MLSYLNINNYALIESLEIEPSNMFTVITGETGAGKSILLGALGLLMGKRADSKSVFNEEKKCIIEGHFDISNLNLTGFFDNNDLDYETTTIIRREISPAGKSRAFINDVPVTLDILKELGLKLMDIHSQHDTLSLGSSDYQLELIDNFAQNNKELDKYTKAFTLYESKKNELLALKKKAETLKKEYDFNLFQLEELNKANLVDGEITELEEELKILENADELTQKLGNAYNLMSNDEAAALPLLREVLTNLNSISGLSTSYAELKDRAQSAFIELQDIEEEIQKAVANVEVNPTRLEEVEGRLNLINSLQKKHAKSTVDELIALKNELAGNIAEVENFDDLLTDKENEMQEAFAAAKKLAESISSIRKTKSTAFVSELLGHLKTLQIPDAQLEVNFIEVDLNATGQDEVSLLFSANKGRKPQSLKEVASGGEFSRLMLVIKYILAQKSTLPTLIFDEIDTGISGEVALKVGKMMKQMSQHLQLLAISHLHQIAGMGNVHYFVYKEVKQDKTFSKLKLLNQEQRINEIAKMIGGNTPSASATQSAKEMLEL